MITNNNTDRRAPGPLFVVVVVVVVVLVVRVVSGTHTIMRASVPAMRARAWRVCVCMCVHACMRVHVCECVYVCMAVSYTHLTLPTIYSV